MYWLLKIKNPKLCFQEVKQYLQKTIDEKKYYEVKNKVKDDVDVVLNHFTLDNYFNSRTYEYQNMASEQLNELFADLNEEEIFILLNSYSRFSD